VIGIILALLMIKGRQGFIGRTPSLGLQEQDHISHITEEALRVNVLDKLKKDRVYCYQERGRHSAALDLTDLGRKETPAAKGPIVIDKALPTREKRTGARRSVMVFFRGVFPFEAKSCQLIGAEGWLKSLAVGRVMDSTEKLLLSAYNQMSKDAVTLEGGHCYVLSTAGGASSLACHVEAF
jgi:hypothetical protein